MEKSRPAVLLLEDGTLIHGKAAGGITTTCGELCFTTSMTGYQETFTDPSYHRQFLIMTHVHTGNYGIAPEEVQSARIWVAGAIIKDLRPHYSRTQAMLSLDQWFRQQNVPIITGVDTRKLILHIRTRGVMRAVLSTETTNITFLKKVLREFPPMQGWELASEVTTTHSYILGTPGGRRIAVIDYGVKQSILRQLANTGAFIRVFPAKTPPEEIFSWNPEGVVLSNGPGDPAAMDYAIELASSILRKRTPLLGICLGHQIIGLALGLKTFKMHYGHRGINHAVINEVLNRAQITSQNHGFCVENKTPEKDIWLCFKNLNDGTVEGLVHKKLPVIGVQFHPEAGPGPLDNFYIFKAFFKMIEGFSAHESIKLAFNEEFMSPITKFPQLCVTA